MSSASPKQPPHSIEAEQSVLGGIMLDNRAWYELADKLNETDFYTDQHRLIYRAIANLMSASKPCDFITLSEQLRREGRLESAGGLAYLSDLAADTPGAANVRAYAEIVRGNAILRGLINAGQEIANLGFEPTNRDHGELVDLAEQVVFRIRERRERAQSGFFEMPPLIGKIQEQLDLQRQNGKALKGAATGFAKLDELTNGLHPGDLVIVAGRPGMGKCLAEDTQVIADDGSLVTAGSLFYRRDSDVATLCSDWTFSRSRPSDYIDDGKKPVFEVSTHLGRQIEVTLIHPFLTPEGWKPLEQLGVGEYIAVPRSLPVFGKQRLHDHEVRLLAYIASSRSSSSPRLRFSPPSARVRQDFIDAVSKFRGCRFYEPPFKADTVLQSIAAEIPASPDEVRISPMIFPCIEVFPEPVYEAVGAALRAEKTLELQSDCVTAEAGLVSCAPDLAATFSDGSSSETEVAGSQWLHWLRKFGALRQNAEMCGFPSVIFRLEKNQLAVFLSCLFAVDGCIFTDKDGKMGIRYSAVNRETALQIQHLLVRFGVIGILQQCLNRNSSVGEWCVDVTNRQSVARFIDQVDIVNCSDGSKYLQMVATRWATRYDDDDDDLLPSGIWRLIERAKGALPWSALAYRLGIPPSELNTDHRISRQLTLRIGKLLSNDNLIALAKAEVSWAQVTSIIPRGIKQVYDLTMPQTHNFVANDICVHNTSFAMNIAEHVSIERKLPVAVFSMEMSAEQLALRILSSYGRIDQQRLRSGELNDEDWASLVSTGGILRDAPLYIDETGALSPLDLRARARRIAARHGLSLIVVDYIQLMQVPSTRENRTNEISEISRSLKALAKELGVPIVALSQLSRGVEQRDNKRPRMSDLRESGGIEQDADVVIFVYRDKYYIKEPSTEPDIAEIIIAKQRNGPTGTIKAAFVGRYTRFDGLTHEYVYE